MKAYSEDLRSRVIGAYRGGEGTQKEIAERFCVSRSSVQQWIRRHNETGSLEPSKAARGPSSKLEGAALRALLDFIRRKPDATLDECSTELRQQLGLSVSPATLCRALKKFGFSRKKNIVSLRKAYQSGSCFAL